MSKPTIGEAVMGTLEAWNRYIASDGDQHEFTHLEEAMEALHGATARLIDEAEVSA